ncbi:MAG: hypothetical protein H6656_08315 [Ardenticatenaceae bacterium]|nr:hypothetical protein [Ardenticatenaceae bacterium]
MKTARTLSAPFSPGEYEPRPRHIHFKVKLDGETLITSQFYFASDNSGQPARLSSPSPPARTTSKPANGTSF